ncbi:MAG: type VI secretion system baseplate subunit TssE [Longimicrobiales bacterium]
MSADKFERTVKASVLDRLIDHEPRQSSDPTLTQAQSERAFRASVLRDVEWLLNTRSTAAEIPEGLEELRQSVFNYGLSDLSSLPAGEAKTRQRLRRHIEDALRTFEPRLVEVRVAVADTDATERRVRFTIEGMLDMDPNPERIMFDSVVEVSSGEVSVDDSHA